MMRNAMCKDILTLVFFTFLTGLIWSCTEKTGSGSSKVISLSDSTSSRTNPDSIPADTRATEINFEKIRERGTIRVILENTSTGYFLYKGHPMGFQYELAAHFCESQNLNMEIIVENDFLKSFQMLLSGEADIIAHALTVNKERKEIVDFVDAQIEVRNMPIQRKPDGWEKMKKHEIEKHLINSPLELIGEMIHVKKGSSYNDRLINLSEEIGGDIDIVEETGELHTEDLIAMVANKQIDFTVADEDLANVGSTYYDHLDVKMPVSLPTQVAWAIRKNSPELLHQLNSWQIELKKKPDFNVLFKKYYLDSKGLRKREISEYSSISGHKISPYDDLIKKYSINIDWDWRLLAALIFQESQFNPNANSWMGARGLMQLVPKTAEEFGAGKVLDPEQNILAGTNYLKWLSDFWSKYVDNPSERLKFVLASYNTGQGHVLDAMHLADKYSKNPQKWEDNVALYLSLKSNPKYYQDPVVQYGYCRGTEPVQYVEHILDHYTIYKQFFQ